MAQADNTPPSLASTADQISGDAALFRAIFDFSETGIVLIRADATVHSASPAFLNMIGYDRREIVDNSYAKFLAPDVAADDLAAFHRSDRTAGRAYHREVAHWHREGRPVWCQVSVTWIAYDGAPMALSIVHDVTQSRQSTAQFQAAETRLRDAVESLDAGFALYDAGDRQVLANRRLIEIVKSPIPSESRVGMTFAELLRAWAVDNRAVFERFDGDAFEQWIARRVARHRNPTGEPFEIRDGDLSRISEHRTKEGGVVYLQTDITDLKRTEAKLRHHQDALHDAIESFDADFAFFDKDDRLVICNEKFIHDWPAGSSKRDAIGMTFEQVVKV